MDWERLLLNFGVIVGFVALMAFWIGLAMWLRVDADKRGMTGWVWAFVGIIAGPLALFAYLIIRGTRPVLEVVTERDGLIEEATRTGVPSDFNPVNPVPPNSTSTETSSSSLSPETQAALEAEERRFRNY